MPKRSRDHRKKASGWACAPRWQQQTRKQRRRRPHTGSMRSRKKSELGAGAPAMPFRMSKAPSARQNKRKCRALPKLRSPAPENSSGAMPIGEFCSTPPWPRRFVGPSTARGGRRLACVVQRRYWQENKTAREVGGAATASPALALKCAQAPTATTDAKMSAPNKRAHILNELMARRFNAPLAAWPRRAGANLLGSISSSTTQAMRGSLARARQRRHLCNSMAGAGQHEWAAPETGAGGPKRCSTGVGSPPRAPARSRHSRTR